MTIVISRYSIDNEYCCSTRWKLAGWWYNNGPGSGGEKKAAEAKLYEMNIRTRLIEWQKVLLPGIQEYSDLFAGPRGLIFGIADKKRFFVFDPKKRQVIHTDDASVRFGPTTGGTVTEDICQWAVGRDIPAV